MITQEELQAIREREEKAEPGPWEIYKDHLFLTFERYGVSTKNEWPIIKSAGNLNKVNAEFVAHSRQDIPALLAEIERLQDEIEQLRNRLDLATGVIDDLRTQEEQ